MSTNSKSQDPEAMTDDKKQLLKEFKGIEQMLATHEQNKQYYKIGALTLFTTAIIGAYMIFQSKPPFAPEEWNTLTSFPRELSEIRIMIAIMTDYSQNYPNWVFIAWTYMYIFLQTFAIPGGIVLSLMAGPLFGFQSGFIYVAICASFGSLMCYTLSATILKGFIINWKPSLVFKICKKVKEQNRNLFFFMLFLRTTPLVPNWFVNLSAPIAGLPAKYFFFGTFFGLMPLNFIHISTGLAINEVSSVGLSLPKVLLLLCLSFAALLPTLLTKGKKLEDEEE